MELFNAHTVTLRPSMGLHVVYQQEDNLPELTVISVIVSFQKLLNEKFSGCDQTLSRMQKICFKISIFPCGMRRNEIVAESSRVACFPVGTSLSFQGFQRTASQINNLFSFPDFCMRASFCNPLLRNNFSGTKSSLQVPKKKG